MTIIPITIGGINVASNNKRQRQQHHRTLNHGIHPRKYATVRLLIILFNILLLKQEQGRRYRRSMFSQGKLASFIDAFIVASTQQAGRRRYLYYHSLHYQVLSSFRLQEQQPRRYQRRLWWNFIPIKRRRTLARTASPATINNGDDMDDRETITLLPTTVAELNKNKQSTDSIEKIVQTWRDHPSINPKIRFPTWICYNGKYIQSILQSSMLQPYLATQLDLVQHLHVRFRVIRKYDEILSFQDPIMVGKNHVTPVSSNQPAPNQKDMEHARFIVLHPDTPKISNLPMEVQTQLHNAGCFDTMDGGDGEDDRLPYVVQFQYHQFTASYIMNQVLPTSVHPVPTAFETVGHVAHLNLKQHHIPYRKLIGEVLFETLPNIETVIQKIGDVSGPFRTFEYEVLAGKENHTFVQLLESGASLHFDLRNVYWCSRLSEERQRLLQHEIFKTSTRTKSMTQSNNNNDSNNTNRTMVIADVFCGVGALCIQAAMANPNVEIWANDWNPHATAALLNNAIRNGVSHQLTRLTTVDAYTFMMELGMMATAPLTPEITSLESAFNHSQTLFIEVGKASLETFTNLASQKVHQRRRYHRKKENRNKGRNDRETVPLSGSIGNEGVVRLPDHVVMNFPLEAPTFLSALRWWSASACGDGHDDHPHPDDSPRNNNPITPRIHVYTFARNSVNNRNGNTYDDGDEDDDSNQGNEVGKNDRSVEDIAVDLVAENLLPPLLPNNSERYKTITDACKQESRRQELNDVYSCNVRTHVVRDVAPGKRVVCVSFTVTSKLLRHMRGDFL